MHEININSKNLKIKKNEKDKITLVIPNRNNDKYLKECLRSVKNQIDKNFIFYVSDNHSSDGSLKIIDSYKDSIDKIISPPSPIGYKEHLFWILEQIQTEFVIFLAGDDIAHTRLIHYYRKSLENNNDSDPAFVCSPFYYIDYKSNIYNILNWPRRFCGSKSDMVDVFIKGPICNISSVAWNVKMLRQINIPEEIGNSIDWYLYIILSNKNDVLLVNKKLLFYRVHGESTGNSNVVAHTDNCKKLFKYLSKNEFKNDRKKLKQINENILVFTQVISGKQDNSIKQIFQKIIYFLIAFIFKFYAHPQLKK